MIVCCSQRGSRPWERTNISCLFYSFRDKTLSAYQAITLWSMSFFTRIAQGAHGSVISISFYDNQHIFTFIVDKRTLLYFVFVSFIAMYLRKELICWTCCSRPCNWLRFLFIQSEYCSLYMYVNSESVLVGRHKIQGVFKEYSSTKNGVFKGNSKQVYFVLN